jgi:hypothetical protein
MQVTIAILTALLQLLPFVGQGSARAAGRALAGQATYTVYTIPGTETRSVLISIPLDEEQFLQLYAPPVLRAFTKAALEAQESAVPEGAQVAFLLMDADHIAGEAALHLTGYVLTSLAGGENGLFSEYHERFRVIDLNVDEARVPPPLLDITGRLIHLCPEKT